MTKSKTTTTQAVYIATNKPGGYLPSDQLDRANAFAAMRLALEGTLLGDRNRVAAAVREAVVDFAPEFASHRESLIKAADRAEASGRLRELEGVVDAKISFFVQAESGTLITAPKNLDASQIHAAELARINSAHTDKYRVRTYNY